MATFFFDLDSAANVYTIGTEVGFNTLVRGLDGADRIIGSNRGDLVLGNQGADTLEGGAGADYLQGGRGADLLLGNRGIDRILGQRGNDVIYGGQDSDTLFGGEGDDFISGDGGTDFLTGDDGSDAFVLDTRHATSDRNLADFITDFSNDDGDLFALTDGVNDALTEADLILETVGTDTFISLRTTGAFLARVQGITVAEIQGVGAFSTVSATLDDTEPGANNLGNLPGSSTLQGFVGDADFVDFFRFQVVEASIASFSLSGLTADADLVVYQDLNDDGELGGDEIISVSERSGNATEFVENVTLDVGQYFIAVEQFEGNTTYSLNISGVAGTVAADLAGDRPSTARALSPDGEVELHDYVGGTDAVDTYRLDVSGGGYLDVFTAFQAADINLTLWSDLNSNDQLDANEVVAQGINEIVLNSANSGTYFVNVTATGLATPYEILAIASAGSRVGIESYNPLFPGISATGNLDQNDEFDPFDSENYADAYLLPELGAGLTVTVTQSSEDFDAYLTVVDLLTGDVVVENDDINTDGGDFNAQVSFTTQLGSQYVVFASSVDAPGFGEYTLNATVTGTFVQNAVSSANSTGKDGSFDVANDSSPIFAPTNTELPPPVFVEQGGRADIGTQQGSTYNLSYQPLNGGVLSNDRIRLSGLNQGRFGNCAFLAAMAATFGKIEDPATADSAVSSVLNGAVLANDGTNFTVRFFDYTTGSAQQATVNNQAVTQQTTVRVNIVDEQGQVVGQENRPTNNLFGADWSNGDVEPTQASGQPIWAPVFERAYAVFRGQQTGRNGYDVTGNGDVGGLPLRRLTGQTVQEFSWNPGTSPTYSRIQFTAENGGTYTNLGSTTPDEIFTSIQAALNQGRYVMSGTVSNAEQGSGNVLIGGHAYSIHNAYVDASGQRMILLRNPWGSDNSKGAKAPEDPSSNTQDGFVAITFQRFLQNYDGVSISQG